MKQRKFTKIRKAIASYLSALKWNNATL